MTNRWSKDEKPVEKDYSQVALEGSFQCHVCEQRVYEAVYVPERQVLTWRCSNGHKSFIEEFKLN